jgi:hypothetical protein
MVGMPFWENEAPSDPKRPSARSSTLKLCSRNSARSSRRSITCRSGTLNKARKVGRGDHIEVDVQRDVPIQPPTGITRSDNSPNARAAEIPGLRGVPASPAALKDETTLALAAESYFVSGSENCVVSVLRPNTRQARRARLHRDCATYRLRAAKGNVAAPARTRRITRDRRYLPHCCCCLANPLLSPAPSGASF